MNPKTISIIVGAVIVVLIVCVGAIASVGALALTCSGADPHPPDPAADALRRYDGDQIANAAIITDVGAQKNVPPWGWVVAVATAIDESSLHNPPHPGTGHDQDGIGLFGQRPGHGWGTPEQLADPPHAAATFYDKLLTIPGWQQMPLTEAAQAVQQHGTHPYAKWTTDAAALVATVGSATLRANPADMEQGASNPAVGLACPGSIPAAAGSLPAGFSLPPATPPAVAAAVWWALGQLGTPYSFGGDCTAAHSGDPAHECDCSSLVQMAYFAGGVALPRITTDQVHAGVAVAGLAQLQVGDLVFIPGSFGTFAYPRHVGLYIGQGLLVQAPQAGDVVKVSPVATWQQQVAAIRRVVT